MSAAPETLPPVALRPPETVMRLARLGAMHASRLSFAPTLLRRMEAEAWRVTRPIWAIGSDGFGHAVYRIDTPARPYSLVAFSSAISPEQRTDRVIAEAWDTSYVLYDGVPDAAAISRLASEVPRQEAGRFTETELILSRANKSLRLFDAVAATLASGRQPEAALLEDVGYLMRTTAVYGNGKFGIADRDVLLDRPEMQGPFRAEMLTVWLIRAFTVDLVEHCAAILGPNDAVRLAPDLRRRLGVGNSTGLGMAPFLVRHPILLHRWIAAREEALARARAQNPVPPATWAGFKQSLAEARSDAGAWKTQDAVQAGRIGALAADLEALAAELGRAGPASPRPFDRIYRWAETHLGLEAQECVVSLLISAQGESIDDLTARMSADESLGHAIDGTMRCGALRDMVERDYGWALRLDFGSGAAQARFWYVSAEKLEPRLGERQSEPGADLEQPLAFGRDIAALHRALGDVAGDLAVADFLLAHPAERHVVRRVQVGSGYPYAEIRDNLVDAAMRPIDLLRCKLSFFGATRFDPRSDRWLRISLFQGAPFPDEIGARHTRAAA